VNCRADAGTTDDQQHRDCEHCGCAQDQSAPRPVGLRALRTDRAQQAAHRGEPREQGLTKGGGTPLRSEPSPPDRAPPSQSTVAQVSTDIENRPLSSRARVVVGRVLSWYATNARDLPWRRPDATPWAIMVSEFMLQQTPVERVRGPWQTWLERWPTPASLAAAAAGDAVRAWGRLGYPRRALRLHHAAQMIMNDFDGQVPEDRESLLRLPGVGAYTAAAIRTFAYGRREMVLDTNVRRLLTRLAQGVAYSSSAPTEQERTLAERLTPRSPERAARWAVASMELGALVCRARIPDCAACPVANLCAWREAGYPAWEGTPRRSQTYQGTDRQCRGALLAVLRSSDEPIVGRKLAEAWQDLEQRDRALASLVQDGLVVALGNRWSLPGLVFDAA
jgi:A/G-specific adenine glycosylase